MQDKLNLYASGEVRIFKLTPSNARLSNTRSNTVLTLSKDIVARLLTNNPIGKIDTLKVYLGATLLATGNVNAWNHPSTNEAEFEVLFEDTDFSGDFDKIQLCASNMGVFAEVSGDGVLDTKLITEELMFSWLITIS